MVRHLNFHSDSKTEFKKISSVLFFYMKRCITEIDMDRIIFHVDLDCFFAAVEILDHPEYKGFPVIIGADPKKGKGRGVVSTCSYEAREFGLHSAMPISKAYHLCPQGIYVKADFKRIKEISEQVMNILKKYSPVFQQVGIDEAYLDMSEIAKNMNDANKIANKIKDEVQSEIGITCSIGIAFTKSLAKIGSDCNKPNGITLITRENYKTILSPLKITRIPGIGKKSKIHYKKCGFQLIRDFYKISKHKMIAKFGDRGRWIYNLINGNEKRKVHDSNYSHHRKSISKERTFYEDTDDYQEILKKITDLNDKIHDILEKKGFLYRTISLKVRFKGYETFLRSKSFNSAIRNKQKALEVVLELYKEFYIKKRKIRLIGLKFSNLKETEKTNQKKILDFIKKN